VIKRYRVCEACRKNRAFRHYDISCPDCGHGDCAPGVVDAGVPWQSEVPTSGAWWVWCAVRPGVVVSGSALPEGIITEGGWVSARELRDGHWRFAPLTIPDPPKEWP
jgi:hypothetical protein